MSLMRKAARAALGALLAATCLMGAVCLTACASAEDQVRSQVESELDALKELGDETLDELAGSFTESDTEVLGLVGIDVRDLMAAYFEGFDYSIDGVSVDGDTADVTVSFTCKTQADLQAAMDGALESVDYASIVDSGDLSPIGTAILDAVRAAAPSDAGSVVIGYRNTDGAWAADESAAETIAAFVAQPSEGSSTEEPAEDAEATTEEPAA